MDFFQQLIDSGRDFASLTEDDLEAWERAFRQQAIRIIKEQGHNPFLDAWAVRIDEMAEVIRIAMTEKVALARAATRVA